MGILSKKSKQSSKPWKQAQPYILNSMSQTQGVFNENQPRIQDMSETAYDAFKSVAPRAFGPSPLLDNAQAASQRFASGEMSGRDPSSGFLAGLMNNGTGPTASREYLTGLLGGSANDAFGEVLDNTLDDVSQRVNARFGASGVGFGRSTDHSGLLARELGRTSSAMRADNFERDQARRLQAAGLLGSYDEADAGRRLQAAGLLSQNFDADQNRQMQAIGMAPQLRLAEFAGVQPALGLLSSAASIPYAGVDALTGNIRQASSGYGTQSNSPGFFDYWNASLQALPG